MAQQIQGIDCRATSGYVTDPTNHYYSIGTSANYPQTTSQGNTVGTETAPSAVSTRDRNSGNDPRLAGTNRMAVGAGNTSVYRFDLTAAGNYLIGLAQGDATYSQPTQCDLFDTNTSLATLCSGSTGAANSFRDAANNVRTAANWVSSQTKVQYTFASTICRFKCTDAGGDQISFANMYIEQVSAAANRGYFF